MRQILLMLVVALKACITRGRTAGRIGRLSRIAASFASDDDGNVDGGRQRKQAE
jgi:hypothetical protein